jgi:phosphatidylinositol glycan class H protein
LDISLAAVGLKCPENTYKHQKSIPSSPVPPTASFIQLSSYSACTIMQIFARITSPATQSLTTYRPTPSTISFTVSTRPVPRTLPAHLLFYFSILLRIILGVTALALLWAKWRIKSPIEGGDVFKGARAELATWVLGTVAGQAVTRVSTGLQWRWLIPGALGVLWGVCRRGYTGMSLSISQLN